MKFIFGKSGIVWCPDAELYASYRNIFVAMNIIREDDLIIWRRQGLGRCNFDYTMLMHDIEVPFDVPPVLTDPMPAILIGEGDLNSISLRLSQVWQLGLRPAASDRPGFYDAIPLKAAALMEPHLLFHFSQAFDRANARYRLPLEALSLGLGDDDDEDVEDGDDRQAGWSLPPIDFSTW